MSNVKCQMVFAVAAICMLALVGCQPPRRPDPTPLCPGKATIHTAAAALAQQRDLLTPLQATADCVIAWDNSGRREPVDAAQVRFVPPDKLFFRGVRFGEIRFGANEDEFWLRIKPELDTYWYGTRDQAKQCSHLLPLNPAGLAEALGVVEVDTQWGLTHRDGRDILTQRGDSGRPLKRVYVNACNYRVERIEYFDPGAQVTAATELSGYTPVGDGPTVPTTIRLTTFFQGQVESSATFTLRQIRRFEPTEQQMQSLFDRPGRDGYKTVLRLDEACNFVEEIR